MWHIFEFSVKFIYVVWLTFSRRIQKYLTNTTALCIAVRRNLRPSTGYWKIFQLMGVEEASMNCTHSDRIGEGPLIAVWVTEAPAAWNTSELNKYRYHYFLKYKFQTRATCFSLCHLETYICRVGQTKFLTHLFTIAKPSEKKLFLHEWRRLV